MKTVRNGQKVWPYCEECGCRLFVKKDGPKYWVQHWWGRREVADDGLSAVLYDDARGCNCSLLLDFWMPELEELGYLGVI